MAFFGVKFNYISSLLVFFYFTFFSIFTLILKKNPKHSFAELSKMLAKRQKIENPSNEPLDILSRAFNFLIADGIKFVIVVAIIAVIVYNLFNFVTKISVFIISVIITNSLSLPIFNYFEIDVNNKILVYFTLLLMFVILFIMFSRLLKLFGLIAFTTFGSFILILGIDYYMGNKFDFFEGLENIKEIEGIELKITNIGLTIFLVILLLSITFQSSISQFGKNK